MTNLIGKYVITRGADSGVYAGTLVSQNGQEVELANCRNIWCWKGANCLLDIADHGVSSPDQCKFSIVFSNAIFTDVCEILPATEKARKVIEGIKSWTV